MREQLCVAVSQVSSVLTNVLIVVVAGRSLSTAEFGAFALANTAAIFLVGAFRASFLEPLLAQRVADEGVSRAARWEAIDTAALLVGAFAAAVGLVLVGLRVNTELAIILIGSPLLLLFDAYRYESFCERRAVRAAGVDIGWFVGVVGVLLVTSSLDVAGSTLLMAWVATSAISLLIARRGSPRVFWRWVALVAFYRRNFDISRAYGLEYLGAIFPWLATIWIAAAVSGPEGAGAVRIMLVLIGLTNLTVVAISTWSLPASLASQRPRRLILGAAALTFVAGTGTALLPSILGQVGAVTLFGRSWGSFEPYVAATAVIVLARSAESAAFLTLRQLQDARAILWSRVASFVVSVPLLVAMSAAADLDGVVWGLVAIAAASAVIWIGAAMFVHRSVGSNNGLRSDPRTATLT